MTLTVCLSGDVRYRDNAGGAAWLYLSWALGLRELGCRVIWLEAVEPTTGQADLEHYVAAVKERLARYGLPDALAICSATDEPLPPTTLEGVLDASAAAAETDLFLNAAYVLRPDVVRSFRRSAFVDADPGLMQIWMSTGQYPIPPHDVYFTIGETVGTSEARFPDCGLDWHFTRLPIPLGEWSVAAADDAAPFTTVSNWWSEEDWIEVDGEWMSNEKRTAFIEYLDLPGRVPVPLELALTLGRTEVEKADRRMLEDRGWRVLGLFDVDWTPDAYRSYVQSSRGEFTCVKPFYARLATGVVLDRTLHYLASGKPAIVQHTGPSSYLPDREGLFRFRTLDEAADALVAAASDYERHSQAARALAETYFDAKDVVGSLLERALA